MEEFSALAGNLFSRFYYSATDLRVLVGGDGALWAYDLVHQLKDRPRWRLRALGCVAHAHGRALAVIICVFLRHNCCERTNRLNP
jgi:hypothetical protein